MDETLRAIEQKVGRNYESPPLELWHPALSGDIAIHIDREGQWFHEGTKIARESIVRLFASILRREDDGEYYLVTPGEKWRIEVALLPLMVTDIDWSEDSAARATLVATLNTGKKLAVSPEQPLYLEDAAEDIAAIRLPHGLAALFSRNAWYRLVDMASEIDGHACIVSAGVVFPLTRR